MVALINDLLTYLLTYLHIQGSLSAVSLTNGKMHFKCKQSAEGKYSVGII